MSPHRIFGKPADEICPECGAVIGKRKRHRKWHKRMERAREAPK